MPIWVRHVVFKWMAPLLRFKLPKKRKPKGINITDMYSVMTEATESTPNNKAYGQKVPKNMVASSIEAVFPRSNEINQSIVRQLSYLNLVNGNHRSSQTVTRQVDEGLRSRLTVTHAEDWRRPSTTANLCSNENRDEQHNSVTCVVTEPPTVNSSDKRMDELLKMQTKLLEYVQMLANVATENEELQEKKYEWSLVASIFDQAFRIAFSIMIFLSTLAILYISRS